MKRLTNDMARCSGLYRLGYTEACPRRDICLRYLSFTRLDRENGIEHYQGMPVVMAIKDCEIYVEAE